MGPESELTYARGRRVFRVKKNKKQNLMNELRYRSKSLHNVFAEF